MSKLLTDLFLFCDKNKNSSKKLIITRNSNIKEVTEHSCDTIELEMTQYECMNIVIDHGEKVLSFMIQGCITTYEDKTAKVYYMNKLDLEFEFTE